MTSLRLPATASANVTTRAAALTGPLPAAPRRTRMVTLDLMRGYYVGVLAAVHLDYLPSLLGLFDGRGSLLVSEAENFFLISGLLVGMLRRRDLERHGPLRMARNAWKRAGQLYVLAVSLTLLFTVIGRLAVAHGVSNVKVGLDSDSSPMALLANTLTLRYTYGWADFLTFYVPMFLIAPLTVWLLSRRLAPVVVLLAYAGFVLPSHYDTSFFSPFLQWGVYFFLGTIAGYHWDDLRRLVGRLSPAVRRALCTGLVVGTVLLYLVGMLLLFHPELIVDSDTYNHLFQNNRLGLLRPFAAPVSFAGTFLLVRKYEEPIARTVGRLLLPFGRSSLYVYVAQSFFVFLIPFVVGPSGFWENTVFDVSVIAVTWFAVRTRFLAFLIPG
ncbi:OpgC domain-containing protein [Kitasatospora sp. NBC_01287]|uniref:OpgC domain-containing protein n=1 Tax=Kitasatospora sp. NBC_01287 TaxID=2903573 RepID=UPI00224FA96A|nr:OpgC domain-containing protein [Kitasatospora sp. NBC_01287]MCX4750793.1 OpgC domain-containing protein [Kitasatospora sp. NBC_01287]